MPDVDPEGVERRLHQFSVAKQLREYKTTEDVIELCSLVLAMVSLLPDVLVVPLTNGALASYVFYGYRRVCCVRCRDISLRRVPSVGVATTTGERVFQNPEDAAHYIETLIADGAVLED